MQDFLSPEQEAAVFAQALTDPEVSARRRAAHHLLGLSESAGVALKPYAGALGAALIDPDAKVRVLATQLLLSLGPAAASQARGLAFALRDDSWEVRRLAVHALAQISPCFAAEVAAAFVAWDARGEISAAELALNAIEALAALGLQQAEELMSKLQTNLVQRVLTTGGQPVVGNLTIVLKPRDWNDSTNVEKAFAALMALGAEAMEELASKLQLLQPMDPEVHELAAEAFLVLGPAAEAHAGTLTAGLLHQRVEVRRLVAEALAELRTEPGLAFDAQVQALVSALGDKDVEVRRHVARALAARAAVPGRRADTFSLHAKALTSALRDEDAHVCRSILRVLSTIELAAALHVGALAPVLRDPEDIQAREEAAEWASDRGAHGLATILSDYITPLFSTTAGAEASFVTAKIRRLRPTSLGSSQEVKTTAALAALAVLRSAAGAALLDALANGDNSVRRHAAEALKALGPLAAPLADNFVPSLRDRDGEVRRHTALAIQFANWQPHQKKPSPWHRIDQPLNVQQKLHSELHSALRQQI